MIDGSEILPNYLDEVTSKLLEKFGKGSHKPGSGSAAAFAGMISCKLLNTVISLTLDPKRNKRYAKHKVQLNEIDEIINEVIFPKLCELFQNDCIVFDKVVKERKNRDKMIDQLDRCQSQIIINQQMLEAIQIPLEIANLCIELSEFAINVFDLGWKAVRGDSGVAIEHAISALGGSIFVINLNMTHISTLGKFAESTRKSLSSIEGKYETLRSELKKRHQTLKLELENKVSLQNSLSEFRNSIDVNNLGNKNYIENLTRSLQLQLWKSSKPTSTNGIVEELEIMDPSKVLNNLGYQVAISDKLGVDYQDNKLKEIAGVCDNKRKLVVISKFYPREVVQFTLAHELGHALMHKDEILFRDIPLESSERYTSRDIREVQANNFAACFLMPKKMVKKEFFKRFKYNSINIEEYKAEMLQFDRNLELRQISRDLASLRTEKYSNSLASTFKVSTEAMAIRLEELKLVVK